MKPTKKQLDFIDDICLELKLSKPNCKTIQEASDWISSNLDRYNFAMAMHRYDGWEPEDYDFVGMQVYDEYEG